eukprot:366478-Chlamydomonas_euryale.AAC.11
MNSEDSVMRLLEQRSVAAAAVRPGHGRRADPQRELRQEQQPQHRQQQPQRAVPGTTAGSPLSGAGLREEQVARIQQLLAEHAVKRGAEPGVRHARVAGLRASSSSSSSPITM